MPRTIFLCRYLAPLLLSISAWAQTPLGELFAADPEAQSVSQPVGSGMTVTSGTELSAGIATAVLKLNKGGQVRICPNGKVSINTDARGLMLGMDTGAMEVNLQLEPNATDIVFTPDLSIRLAGSGVYHFAVGLNGQGDTCFKPLRGNAAGIVVSELMGSDEYGIVADQTAFFPGGKLSAKTSLTSECGCPAPSPAKVFAETKPPAAGDHPTPSPAAGNSAVASEVASPSSEGNRPSHTSVEAPFVFSANAPPTPARVQFSSLPNVFLTQEDFDPPVLSDKGSVPADQQAKSTSSPPAGDSQNPKKGLLGKIKGFFTGLFHR